MDGPKEGGVAATTATTPSLRTIEAVAGTNPYIHFIVSEAWGGLAGIAVYAMFHAGAYVTDVIVTRWPLHDDAPSQFFVSIMHWGAAIGGSATFCVITTYQVVMLVKRLWSEVSG